jgi:hypothetical protein
VNSLLWHGLRRRPRKQIAVHHVLEEYMDTYQAAEKGLDFDVIA